MGIVNKLDRERTISIPKQTLIVLRIIAVMVLLFVGADLLVSKVSAQTDGQRVLILNSYHYGFSWTDTVVGGILSVFDPEDYNNEIYIEYMDAKRFEPTPEFLENLAALYEKKYQDVEFDVLISTDNVAFEFLRQYKTRLFPETPVVFCGVNSFSADSLSGHSDFTGVAESTDIKATLDLALELHPETSQIVIINDKTPTGVANREVLDEILPDYTSRYSVMIYEEGTIEQIRTALATLSHLSQDSLVLYLLINRDSTGTFFTFEESFDYIYPVISAPIYSVWDFYLGRGMVGGMVTSGHLQGVSAGELAQRILAGESVGDIPVQIESPNRYIFDYEALRRFGISTTQLPPGSEIVNQREIWIAQRSPGLFWAAVIGTVALIVVITFQQVYLNRQQRTELELRKSNRELNEIRSSLEEHIAERTRDAERRSELLKAAAMVSRETAAVRDVTELMDLTVNLISKQFGFYHAAIFLFDDSRSSLVLKSASSDIGVQLVAQGFMVQIEESLLPCYVSRTGELRVVRGLESEIFSKLGLGQTRSELGIPLQIRGRVIGVLDVHSEAPDAFTGEDIEALETITEQLSLYIENARLLYESQEALKELDRRYGTQITHAWQDIREKQRISAYRYTGVEAEPGELVIQEDTPLKLESSIELHGVNVGSIILERDTHQKSWTPEELTLVETVSAQAGLALEYARLLDETQQRAERERIIGEISSRMRETLDLDTILQTALREIGRTLAISDIEVRMGQGEVSGE
ncbi:MAG: GAF domain-containing protein [Anaerolineae bacterium]|nr:GAF domain-containing protein [Anaerolineae bacterium]